MVSGESLSEPTPEPTMADGELKALIERAIKKDEDALSEIYNRYRLRLGRYVESNMSARGQSRTSADDIVQDALLTIVQKLDSLEYRGVAAFESWMLQITEGKIRDFIRHISAAKRDSRRERGMSDEESMNDAPAAGANAMRSATPSKIVYKVEKGRIVGDILDKLSDRHAEVLRLRLLKSLPFAEIGTTMGITEDAAKALFGRAALKFKDMAGRHPGVADFTEVMDF